MIQLIKVKNLSFIAYPYFVKKSILRDIDEFVYDVENRSIKKKYVEYIAKNYLTELIEGLHWLYGIPLLSTAQICRGVEYETFFVVKNPMKSCIMPIIWGISTTSSKKTIEGSDIYKFLYYNLYEPDKFVEEILKEPAYELLISRSGKRVRKIVSPSLFHYLRVFRKTLPHTEKISRNYHIPYELNLVPKKVPGYFDLDEIKDEDKLEVNPNILAMISLLNLKKYYKIYDNLMKTYRIRDWSSKIEKELRRSPELEKLLTSYVKEITIPLAVYCVD